MDVLWLAGLLLPALWAVGLACLPRRADRLAAPLAILGAALTAVAITGSLTSRPAGASPEVVAGAAWVPALGLGWLWIRDGLSGLFAVLTAGIGALVTLYSWRYLPHAQEKVGSTRREASYYALLSAFTAAMLALVSAGNLLQLYVAWELTGLASFLLIGFWHQRDAARRGAARGLILTTAGGLALLVGLLLLGRGAAWDLPTVLATRTAWAEAPWVGPCAALIAIGALAKSAQFPFSSWLPAAMAAPTPVSAFLHSAALVAAGIYVLARFHAPLSHATTWAEVLITAGLIGAIAAGLAAIRQSELKALLAYSTVAQYAFIVLAFGLGSLAGVQAAMYAFFVHAPIKAGLFLVAGAVTHVTGATRFEELGGIARAHPALAGLAVVLALSLGGVPIFGGFYYKEELLHAAVAQEAWLLAAAMLFGGMLTMVYMLRFLHSLLWGGGGASPPGAPGRPLPASMLAPIALLAGVALFTGIFPGWMNQALLDPALATVVQAPVRFTVELHVGLVLLLSLGVLAGAAGLAAAWARAGFPDRWVATLPERAAPTGEAGRAALAWLGDRALDLHAGDLRRYLRMETAAALAIGAWCWMAVEWGPPGIREAIDPNVVLLLAICLLAAVATIWLRRHVLAVIALTISGYALAGVFALMHAPDVALAQVLVETLATIAIVVALRYSGLIHPERTEILTAGRRDVGRWAIAGTTGLAVAWLVAWVGRGFPPDPAGAALAREGFARAGMNDLVTAILADFRALDTAIEILVFACAALAVMGLVRPHAPTRRLDAGGPHE